VSYLTNLEPVQYGGAEMVYIYRPSNIGLANTPTLLLVPPELQSNVVYAT